MRAIDETYSDIFTRNGVRYVLFIRVFRQIFLSESRVVLYEH